MYESELTRASDVDPLAAFDRAVDRVEYALDFDPVFERRKVRPAFRERRYEIGYNRAGRLMDQMEHAGIVGPAQGSKPRQVLVSPMDIDQLFS